MTVTLFCNRHPSGTSRNSTTGARIGHVNLRVTDLERSITFYRDLLGLEVSFYGPPIGVPTVFMTFGDYHHHIALSWYSGDINSSRHHSHHGLNHFAIAFPDENSLATVATRLLEQGDLIDYARDHGSTFSIYLQDPDGNGIELYYDQPRVEWFDPDGDLIIKSEPVDVRQWLEELRPGFGEVLDECDEDFRVGAMQ